MEFELWRLPPQRKTMGPWTFQQGGRAGGGGGEVCIRSLCIMNHFLHIRTVCSNVYVY